MVKSFMLFPRNVVRTTRNLTLLPLSFVYLCSHSFKKFGVFSHVIVSLTNSSNYVDVYFIMFLPSLSVCYFLGRTPPMWRGLHCSLENTWLILMLPNGFKSTNTHWVIFSYLILTIGDLSQLTYWVCPTGLTGNNTWLLCFLHTISEGWSFRPLKHCPKKGTKSQNPNFFFNVVL